MTKQAIFSAKLAKAAGPFSPAINASGLVFISGQIGQIPATGALVEGGVEREAEQLFENMAAVLEAAGKDFSDVLRVGVFLTDLSDFALVNRVYATYFPEPFPARTTVAVTALPLGASVELDAIVRG